ncbi:hypothetical protein ACIF6K_26645 [Streptomyces sp. NPDC085942]|uniref:hypothetical protein n=1 Tax=Streptomyces sp. NPDC085942 TaxID=3365743 RepID=UPI0037D61A57
MIPDAVAAIIAATIRDHSTTTPEEQGRKAVRALRDAGWTIVAPEAVAAVLRAA